MVEFNKAYILQETYDFLIVGAGIVGLTLAFQLKKIHPNSTICIIEKESELGVHASGRNSGVLHSGVYYGNTTLKSKVCSAGAKEMAEFALEHGIPYKKAGKLIVPSCERDLFVLDNLLQNARDNGVNVELLDENSAREIEPYVRVFEKAIYSPDTALIDSRAVVLKLAEILKLQGCVIKRQHLLVSVCSDSRSVIAGRCKISYGFLFNCAGAYADIVAKKFGLAENYTLIPFKGIYYKIKPERAHLVKANIYPVPDVKLPFLGVHLTRVIGGEVYVGPTAIPAFGRENYGVFKGVEFEESIMVAAGLSRMYLNNNQNFRQLVHAEMKKYFKYWIFKSARSLVNSLKYDDLVPSNKVGIRPQLININNYKLEMDYILEKDAYSAHVLNSISPAFTSSFAFSKWILDQVNVK